MITIKQIWVIATNKINDTIKLNKCPVCGEPNNIVQVDFDHQRNSYDVGISCKCGKAMLGDVIPMFDFPNNDDKAYYVDELEIIDKLTKAGYKIASRWNCFSFGDKIRQMNDEELVKLLNVHINIIKNEIPIGYEGFVYNMETTELYYNYQSKLHKVPQGVITCKMETIGDIDKKAFMRNERFYHYAICSNCDRQVIIRSDDVFCSKCGARIVKKDRNKNNKN